MALVIWTLLRALKGDCCVFVCVCAFRHASARSSPLVWALSPSVTPPSIDIFFGTPLHNDHCDFNLLYHNFLHRWSSSYYTIAGTPELLSSSPSLSLAALNHHPLSLLSAKIIQNTGHVSRLECWQRDHFFLSQRTCIGTPFLRLKFSALITNGLRACSTWRTGSCVRRHIVPHGPAQPSRIANFAK